METAGEALCVLKSGIQTNASIIIINPKAMLPNLELDKKLTAHYYEKQSEQRAVHAAYCICRFPFDNYSFIHQFIKCSFKNILDMLGQLLVIFLVYSFHLF